MLAGFQDAFVALAADGRLRRAFAEDPAAALASFERDARARGGCVLGDRERAALLALPAAELERYARSLVEKRWGELAKVVPLTLRVAPSLAGAYRAWAVDHPARIEESVLPPGIAEALRALPALRAHLAGEGEAAYAADLCSFEALRAASRVDGGERSLRARHAIHVVAADVTRGLLPVDPPHSPTEVRWAHGRAEWRPL